MEAIVRQPLYMEELEVVVTDNFPVLTLFG